MRCLSILILAGVFCTVSAKVYSLGEIVGITVKNSRSIRIIEQEMYKSEAEVQAVYGQSFPHVSLQMNLSHNFSKVDYGFAPTGNEFIDNLFKSISSTIEPKQSSGQIGLTLDQPLFAQGKVYYGLKLAKKNRVILNCKLQEEKLRVRGFVVKQYFNALMHNRNYQIANESVIIAREAHRVVTARQSVGTSSEYDTLSSRLHLKNAELALTKTDIERRSAYEKLLTTSGIAESLSSFSLIDSLPLREYTLDLDQTIELVKKDNLTLVQLSGYGEVFDYRIKLAQTEYLPGIFAGITLGRNGQLNGYSELDNIRWVDSRIVHAGLKWDIFSGTIRSQRLSQARIDRTIFDLNEKQAIDTMILAARNAYDFVTISKEQLVLAGEAAVLAEKALSLAKISYDAGSKIYLDLQNAELELHKAKMAENNARYTYFTSVVDLQILTGTLQF
ncbi:MAG: TolC family protein [Fibrobacter sp.]|nr:TolC family protein [Fibrobacter sp.]